jgi:hypothetical protein
LNTEDIVALKTALVARDADRHAKYDLLMRAVGGDYESRRLSGFWQDWKALTGKSVEDHEVAEFQLNLIPSIIRAKRKFIATVPSIKCPPAAPEEVADGPLAKAAEKLERIYQGFWQASYIGRRMNQLGYWNPTLGTSIGVVWPDMDNHRPSLQIRSPYGFYPVVKDVDGYELSAAIFHTTYKGREVQAMFPSLASKINGEAREVPVTQYLDTEEIVTIVDDQYRVNPIENRWGFVPIVMIPNESFGEGPWGDNDIEWALGPQDTFNYRETIKDAILTETIMQPLAIIGGENLPEEIPMGPRDAVPVQMGGDVRRVQPVQVPFQYLQSQSDLLGLIDRVGGVPDVLRSQFDGSTLTGRGVASLLGPTLMEYSVKGNEIYPALAKLNKMAMKMWDAMWGSETHTVYSLGPNKSVQVESFKTGEFQGWYENIVYVDAASYYDAQSRFVMILQAVQNRLMSRSTAMQFVPGVDDPVLENRRIEAELKKDQELAMASQAFADANAQPNMAQQGATNANLQKGYMGEMPPMEAVGGLEPPEQEAEDMAAEEQLEQGTLLEDLIELFTSIGKLKGNVWLAGDIVTNPAYGPDAPNWTGIEVFVENKQDKGTINRFVKNNVPEVWGNIVYHDGAPNPDEPAIQVYAPEGELEALPGEEMPQMGAPAMPDMAQMAELIEL